TSSQLSHLFYCPFFIFAREYEQLRSTASSLRQIIGKYGEVIDKYSDTPAGKEAGTRKARLTILYEESEREFIALQNDLSSAGSANQFDQAIRAVERFIAQTSEQTGKPFLEEANALLQSGMNQAGLAFHRLLGEIMDGLASGRQDWAVAEFAKLRDMRIIALCPESARAHTEVQREIASVQARIEADKAAAEQDAKKRVSWRTRVSATMAEARRLESEGQYGESLLEYKKAILFAGGTGANEAVEGIAGLETLVQKTQAGLLSILSSARNWTVAKHYAKAAEKCKEVIATASFKPFHGKIESAISGLTELEQSKGDPKAMMKKFDDLQKEINDWAASRLEVDPALLCHNCEGDGTESCEACSGGGQTEGPPCVLCGGGGQKYCETCGGMGSMSCPTCRGTGMMTVSETQMHVCSSCRGTGNIRTGTRCTRCGGSGRLKVHVTTGRMTCTNCSGTTIAICSQCQNGLTQCKACRGSGKRLVSCKQCNGAGGSRCKSCCGSGLAAEKF
ncbi:MAG: hypothetical protein RDV41_14635, partial [Planctomycetota bacterium]|nr:hypothetical protein [Planctomycetota bacterium]